MSIDWHHVGSLSNPQFTRSHFMTHSTWPKKGKFSLSLWHSVTLAALRHNQQRARLLRNTQKQSASHTALIKMERLLAAGVHHYDSARESGLLCKRLIATIRWGAKGGRRLRPPTFCGPGFFCVCAPLFWCCAATIEMLRRDNLMISSW